MTTLVSIAQGGTGANNATQARLNLGITPASTLNVSANGGTTKLTETLNFINTASVTINVSNAASTTNVSFDVIAGLGFVRDSFVGNGSEVNFTLSGAPVNEDNSLVFVDRVLQRNSEYNVSATTLTFTAAPDNGAVIDVFVTQYLSGNAAVLRTGDTMTGELNVSAKLITQNIEPAANITYNLGTNTKRFKDLWLSNSTIYLGDVQISANAGKLVVPAVETSSGINLESQVANSYAQANAAYGQANTARSDANTTFATINTSFGTINTNYQAAYAQANNAYASANLAYAAANNSNLKLGGLVSGTLNVTQDLIVGGNIYLEGNTTYINVATYSVEDSLIYMASNNKLTDSVDIGFMGGKNTGGSYAHTGLARDATDGKWKLFDGLAEEGHVGNVVDFANTYLATLVANVEANTLTVVSGVSGNVNFDSGTLFVDSVGNSVGIGTTSPNNIFHVVKNSLANVNYNNQGGILFEGSELQMQLISDDGGSHASKLTLSTVVQANGTNKHWMLDHKGPSLGNRFDVSYFTSNSSGNILAPSGVELLTILTDGKVGIGITNPSQKFEVAGTIRGEILNCYSSTDPQSTSPYFYQPSTGALGIGASGSERIRVTSGGNVGIGTTTTPGRLTVGTATVTDNNSLVFNRGVKPSIAASQAAILTEWNGIGSSECMTLMADAYKWLDDTGNSEWMRITSAGNFGFGTSSPVSTSLNGSATFYKIHNNDSASIPSTSAQAYDVNQSNLFLFGRNSGITIVSKFNEGGHILFGDEDRARSGGIEYSHTTDALTIVTNGSERGRFTTAGDFLVGTTNSDIGGSVAGIRLAPSGKMLASTNTASGLFYDEPLYLDRRDTSGDGTCIVLARHGYYKAGIGVVRGAAVGSEGSITFSTATNSGFNERMRINSSGNVGIGTSPATYSRLHVYGSTGAISSPGLIYSQNADDASALYISNNGTTAQYDRAVFEVYTANGSTNLFKILNGGAISTPRNPAFFARRTTGFTLSAGSTVIVYDSEVGDRTSNYNNSNGRFTAPVAGYYFFRAHVQPTTSGVNVNITFYVNGSLIPYQSFGTTNLYARGDIINDIVYPLNQSDYVEVVVTVSSSCGFDNHGTFAGYLVG